MTIFHTVQDEHRRSGHSLHPREAGPRQVEGKDCSSAPYRSRLARIFCRVRQDLAYADDT